MWTYTNPTRVVVGAGAVEGIGGLIGGRPYCLVTYGEPHFAALAGRIEALAGPALGIVGAIAANPDYGMLDRACRAFAGLEGAAVIVALGGGSVIDAAKVVAAARGDFARVRRCVETGAGRQALRPLPLIAVPTTAGSGSEVTCWASVWDGATRRKRSLELPSLYPEHAVVDPVLTLEAPRDVTVSSGLDALSHALESIWNVNANPVSSGLAVDAASRVLKRLPAQANDLANLELRTDLARAALLAGLAFSNTRTALAHALSYPLTLRHGVAHGIACSFSLPLVMRAALGADERCDASLGRIFGPDLAAGAETLEAFLTGLGVGLRPEDHGVGAAEWRDLVEAALAGERGRNFLGRGEAVLAVAR